MLNIPLILTAFRIFAIPLVVLFYFLPFQSGHFLAAGVFLLAALTDWLDGYLARTLSQGTALGAFLDPVADKLLVVTALILVIGERSSMWLSLIAAVIVGREIAVSALREWMAEQGHRVKMAVVWIAKVKTASQMLALTLLIAYRSAGPQWLLNVGYGVLAISATLTIWSMLEYLKIAWPDLTSALRIE